MASARRNAARRGDWRSVRPADHGDPACGATLREAAAGVRTIGVRFAVSPEAVVFARPLRVELAAERAGEVDLGQTAGV